MRETSNKGCGLGRGRFHMKSAGQQWFKTVNTSDSDIPRQKVEYTLCCPPLRANWRAKSSAVAGQHSAHTVLDARPNHTDCPMVINTAQYPSWQRFWPRSIGFRHSPNSRQSTIPPLQETTQLQATASGNIVPGVWKTDRQGDTGPWLVLPPSVNEARPTSRRSRTAPQPTVRPVVVLRPVTAAALSRLRGG